MKRPYEIVVLSKGAYARTLRIFVPKKADRAIIMHDGQNVFLDGDSAFGKSWRAAEILRRANIRNTAIIGIDNTSTREDDYIPFVTELNAYGVKPVGGKADIYCDFISTNVMRYLEQRFKFRYYAMLGSSAGASATLHYAARRDTRFKAYGLFSTPLFLCPNAYKKFFETAKFDPTAYYQVYVGGRESEDVEKYARLIPDMYVEDAHTLVVQLRKSGVSQLSASLNNKAIHDELTWRNPEREFFKVFSQIR